jgi:tetratricopeptide (TPR) repeat protein
VWWRQVVADARSAEKNEASKLLESPHDFRGSFSGRERNVFFHNPNKESGFYQVGYALGLDSVDDERSIIPVDVDQDGDLDILTSSLQRLKLFENTSPNKSFVRLRLEATKTQHYALGAQVVVTANGVVQRDYPKLTAGFQSQVPRELHFGLADAKSIEKIEVSWPSGDKSIFTQLAPNQRYVLTEGDSHAKASALKPWPADAKNRPLKRRALTATAQTLTGTTKPLAEAGMPTVLNFWAPWCKPCAKELPQLKRLAEKFSSRVQFVGVSIEREKKELVDAAIRKYKITYPQFYANDAIVESFFGSDGQIPLPSTFVFSASGQLIRAFSRAIQSGDLEATLEELGSEKLNPEFIRPITESYLSQGRHKEALSLLENAVRNYPENPRFLIQLGNILLMMNRAQEALPHLKLAVKKAPKSHYAWYLMGIGFKKLKQGPASLDALSRSHQLAPQNFEYAMSLGAAQSTRNDLKSALKTFQKATKIKPRNVLAWINLGKAHALLKQPEDASQAFKQALSIDPENPIAKALYQRYGR